MIDSKQAYIRMLLMLFMTLEMQQYPTLPKMKKRFMRKEKHLTDFGNHVRVWR